MKKVFIFLVALSACFGLQSQNAQETEPSFSVRASGAYQFFSFSGIRTNSSSFGAVIEKRINYSTNIGLNFQYITRTEEAEIQKRNQPNYQNVIHFTPFFRKYFEIPFTGAYAGMGFGIGIPETTGVQTELGGHFGYVIRSKSLVLDIGIQTGFGSFRYNEDVHGVAGNYIGSTFYSDWGFFFRPGVSIGFAK